MNVEHESMEQVRKDLRISWYRCPIDRGRLKELTSRSDLEGALQTFGHLALLALTGLATYSFFDLRIWVGFALALFAHGTIYSFIPGLATHELSHGTVFKTRWLNGLFLRLFGLLGWFNHHSYKMSHTYHHLYTLYPRGDREVVLPRNPSLRAAYLLQLFTVNIFGGLESVGLVPTIASTFRLAVSGKFDTEWLEAVFADQAEARRKAINWARLLILFHLGVIAVAVLTRLWLLPVLVTFAPFIGNWWRYFVGMPMHTGLRDNVPDFRLCVRTITLDPFSKFLYWRMSYHTEHHMFAAVPCYHLRNLHETVAFDMPKPRTLVGAWREMRQTWKRQQVDPGYQYDTPLPRRKGGPSQSQDPLSGSLGDLAPGALE